MRTVTFSTCLTRRLLIEDIESRKFRIPIYSCDGELPFDPEELEGQIPDSDAFKCSFNRVFRSSLYITLYNKYIRVGAEEIRRQEAEDFNVLMAEFRDSNHVILSSVDKESLHRKVGKLGATLEKCFSKFAALGLDRSPVYDASDSINKLSLERLQELEVMLLETYYPKFGLTWPDD